MSDTTLSVMAAVIAALKASGALTAIVGQRIYSDVPDNPVFPFVVVTVQSAPFDTQTTTGMDHTVQVSCFSRSKTLQEAVSVREKVYNILNRGEASLTSAGVWRSIYSGVGPVLKEGDGATWQALTQYTITTG